ncbi:hypothetical protein VNI00_001705 [Paramarasmius palmivorus]|uniref:Uncharacterized protein n=1 Tax=Paramarasmius palmivorus TaxID=297713 RepID=A0AAW0E4B4_9AGAR
MEAAVQDSFNFPRDDQLDLGGQLSIRWFAANSYMVPSFSSFPPSFDSFPDLDAGPSVIKDTATRELSSQKKDKSKKKDKTKHRDKDSRKKRRRDEHFSEDDNITYRSSDSNSRLFYSDWKGDPLNIQYGGIHKGDIPRYNTVNRGRKILGLSSEWTAFARNDQGIIVGKDRHQIPTLTDPKTRHLLAATPTPVQRSGGGDKYEEIDGFLPLPSNNKAVDYRSITKGERDSDSDSEADSNSDLSGPGSADDETQRITLSSHQETLRALEQDLLNDPASVSSWLKLVTRTLSTIDLASRNSRKARAEVAISILDRALSAHSRNKFSKRLRLMYMTFGSEIWSEPRINEEWEKALKLGDVDVWIEWLEWKIGRASDGVSGIFDAAARVLAALDSSLDHELGKIRVLWRVAVACQQAGFPERATALFQAQAELLFGIPQALHGLPFVTILDALEEFWESEVPRIGEVGSKGWSIWHSQRSETHVANPVPSGVVDQADLDPYRQWGISESLTDRVRRWSLRSTDDSDDPYATILFSDIRPVLVSLENQRAKDAFRMVWLSVLGLHVPGLSEFMAIGEDCWDDRWCLNGLTSPGYLNTIFPSDQHKRLSTESHSGVLVGRQKEYANSFGPVKHWTLGSVGALASIFGQRGMWDQADLAGLDVDYIRRIFSQLRLGAGDVEWDTLALAFEAAINVKSALKLSKTFLEAARDSLAHWAAHAQLERMRGRLNEARKVYQTVLIASSSPARRSGESQLWWDWAEMEWIAGQSEQALAVIMKSAGVEGHGGVAFLRSKRALSEEAERSETWREAEDWTKLGTLLDLLTSNNLATCQQMFQERLDSMRIGHVGHESMTISVLLFLYTHTVVLKNPVPPAILREAVEKALDSYPSNSIILSLFLECEKGQGIWGRVRGLLGSSGGNAEKDVARKVQEVWIARWEEGRWESEVERIRSGLAVALDHGRTRGSPVLWRMYLELEIRTNRLEQAKKLLYRAIGECPYYKELYVLAFVPLRGVFSARELDALADVMAERGIRMRRGLDEVVADWKGEEEERRNNEVDYDGEDEIEYNARELKRLKPY